MGTEKLIEENMKSFFGIIWLKIKSFFKRFWRIIVPITAAAGIGAAVVTTPIYILPDYLNEDIGCVKNVNGDWVAFDLKSGEHRSKLPADLELEGISAKEKKEKLIEGKTATSTITDRRYVGKKKDSPCVFFEGKSLNNYSTNEINKKLGKEISLVEKVYAAVNFNATTDKITFQDAYDFEVSDAFTVEFWAKVEPTTACDVFIDKHDANGRWIAHVRDCVSAGTVAFLVGPSGGNRKICRWDQGGSAVDDGDWHHFAFVNSASGTTCASFAGYVDGISRTLTQEDTGSAANASACVLTLGDDSGSGCTDDLNPITGSVDELRIWNYARSADLIAGNMWLRIPDQEGLIGYWRLDEGVGVTNAVRPFGSHASSTNVFGTLTSVDWVDSAPVNYPE